jgi:hypothetical protein
VDKVTIKQLIIYTFALMIVFPVMINILMFIEIFPVAGDEKTWISSLNTFWGAIIGGVIAGVLTLLGVRITIRENHDKDFKDSLPEKIMFSEDIIFVLERQLKLLLAHDLLEVSPSTLNPAYRARIKFILGYLEDDGLLVKSSKINLETYRSIRNLHTYLKNLQYNDATGIGTFPYSEINNHVSDSLRMVKKGRDSFVVEMN